MRRTGNYEMHMNTDREGSQIDVYLDELERRDKSSTKNTIGWWMIGVVLLLSITGLFLYLPTAEEKERTAEVKMNLSPKASGTEADFLDEVGSDIDVDISYDLTALEKEASGKEKIESVDTEELASTKAEPKPEIDAEELLDQRTRNAGFQLAEEKEKPAVSETTYTTEPLGNESIGTVPQVPSANSPRKSSSNNNKFMFARIEDINADGSLKRNFPKVGQAGEDDEFTVKGTSAIIISRKKFDNESCGNWRERGDNEGDVKDKYADDGSFIPDSGVNYDCGVYQLRDTLPWHPYISLPYTKEEEEIFVAPKVRKFNKFKGW